MAMVDKNDIVDSMIVVTPLSDGIVYLVPSAVSRIVALVNIDFLISS
jgi:hypothetical protein